MAQGHVLEPCVTPNWRSMQRSLSRPGTPGRGLPHKTTLRLTVDDDDDDDSMLDVPLPEAEV